MPVYNFNPGPAALPKSVLEQVQAELLDYKGLGISILEMSHRSEPYEIIHEQAQRRLMRLLKVEEGYKVLFMQGGASAQFAILPMNFLLKDMVADYVLTGVWSEKALKEAQKIGEARIAASSQEDRYRFIPERENWDLSKTPAYVHITSNNTIYGTQWHSWPDVGMRRLVVDMSSDILSRPVDGKKFALMYAGAQKNLGPAGVTVVILRESWLEEAPDSIPTIFQYKTFAKENSLYNTPPVFSIYVLNLVLKWIETNGGVEGMGERNEKKAKRIYDAIDNSSGFYRGHAMTNSRSQMNVTFRLPSDIMERQFLTLAEEAGMMGLAGHRTTGGIRASLYNALEMEACEALASFMEEFAKTMA